MRKETEGVSACIPPLARRRSDLAAKHERLEGRQSMTGPIETEPTDDIGDDI